MVPFNAEGSQKSEEMEFQPGMEDNVTSSVSNAQTNVLHVTCETSNADATNTIANSIATSHVLEVVSASDVNLSDATKITDQNKEFNSYPDVNYDMNCDSKAQNQPITLVCEPDILNPVKEIDIDLNKKQIMKVNLKQSLSSKRGIINKSTKSDKRKEDEKAGYKKGKRSDQSSPKVLKKKPKQIRDLEKTLNCLLSDSNQVKDEKAFAFAQSYFLKVTETLFGKDDTTYNRFMKTMNDFGVTIFEATELFRKVTKIFENYPDLADEFLAFLLPEQAMECGKFMEYIILTKMKSFCRKLEVYYAKQPSQLRKIYSSLAALAANNQATMDDLKNTIIPLLKNNSLLVNMFLELMPSEAPHASSLNYYECMDFKRVNLQNPNSEDWFETIEVPPPVEDNMYGGEDCICSCHLSSDNKRQSKHCVSCGTKFIQGRVYLRSGGMLHPAKVSFKEVKSKVLERLSVKSLKSQKMGKNQSSVSGNKKNCSTKSEALLNNTPKASGKLSTTKATRKGARGKDLNDEQKQKCKILSPPKNCHTKKTTSDKKLSKTSRKRIRTLTNSDDDICKESCQSISLSKSISKVAKGTVKSVSKNCSKVEHQTNGRFYAPIEKSYRRARPTSRGKAVTSNSNLRCNRKQVGVGTRGESSNVSLSVIVNRMSEAELMLKTQGMDTCVENEKFGHSHSSYSSEMINNNVVSASDDEKKDDKCDILCDSDLFNKLEYSSESARISEKELGAIEESEIERVTMKNNSKSLNGDSSNREISHSKNIELSYEGCLHCSETTCTNRDSSDQCNGTMQECKLDNLSCSTENLSCSETEDIAFDKIEMDTTDENISSEEDKNVLDLDNMHSDSSLESNIRDCSQMDIDDFCDVSESSPSSQHHDSHSDTDSDEACRKSDPAGLEHSSWTRDEDKVILRTFQSFNGSEMVFEKICDELPNRTADEVKLRFQALMSFLQKITGDPVFHEGN